MDSTKGKMKCHPNNHVDLGGKSIHKKRKEMMGKKLFLNITMLSENICPFNTGSSDNKHEHHSPASKHFCKKGWRIKFKYDSFKHTLRLMPFIFRVFFFLLQRSRISGRLNGFNERIFSIDCEDIFSLNVIKYQFSLHWIAWRVEHVNT